jgi:hypothetical protein
VLELRVGSATGEDTIEGFDPNHIAYQVQLPALEDTLILRAEAQDPSATIEVRHDGAVVPFTFGPYAMLDVPIGRSELKIQVAVDDYFWTYTVRIERMGVPFQLGALQALSGQSVLLDCTPDPEPGYEVIRNLEGPAPLIVNPTDPDHLAALWGADAIFGALGVTAGVSFDGGNTWESDLVPKMTQCSGGTLDMMAEPWLAFDANGGLHYLGLSYDGFEDGDVWAILYSRSSDGGLTWSDPWALEEVTNPAGRVHFPTITADPVDPDVLYSVWLRDDQPNADLVRELRFSKTVSGGDTWSPPQTLFTPAPGYQTGIPYPQLHILPDGTLVALFVERRVSDPTRQNTLTVLRSADGGATWSDPIGGPVRHVATPKIPNTGEPFPYLVYFNTAMDPETGALYAVWADTAPVGVSLYAATVLSRSLDGGLTWSDPAPIGQTPQSGQYVLNQSFLANVAVAAGGWIGVTYYDFRYADVAEPESWMDAWFIVCNARARNCTLQSSWSELRLTDSSFDALDAIGPGTWLTAVGSNFATLFVQASPNDPGSVYFRRVNAR